eukprot:XP_015150412.1 mitochondrial fission process protein 1 isoform X1 [Gallus gallus]
MTQTQLPPPGPYLPLSCPSQPHNHAPVRSPAAPRSQPRFRPGPPSRLRVPPTWRQRWGHVVPGLAFPAATLEPGKWAGRVVMTSRGAAPGPWPRAGAGGGAPWGRRSPTCTGTRGSATWAHAQDPGRARRVGVAVADTFVWQSLASVAIPGFTINRLCAASLALLASLTRWPLPVRKWATTALGLSAIPVIITPIDRSVDFLMDSSIRKLYGTEEPPSAP